MLIERNPVPKFILLSLAIHLIVVIFVSHYYHPENIERAVKVSIINGSSAAQVLRMMTEPPLKPEKVAPQRLAAPTAAPKTTAETNPKDYQAPVQPSQAGSTEIETLKDKYKRTLAEIINSRKRYPQRALSLNQEGVVVIRMILNKSGVVKKVEILDQSPYKSLATASLDIINSIHKFPPIPKELEMEEYSVKIPIKYEIEM